MRRVTFALWCVAIVAGIAWGMNTIAERREASMRARLACTTDLDCCTKYHDCEQP